MMQINMVAMDAMCDEGENEMLLLVLGEFALPSPEARAQNFRGWCEAKDCPTEGQNLAIRPKS
jgi:hypothetical protein